MARASTDRKRGAGSRVGRPLKILVGAFLVLLVLLLLNAFALNNETGSAKLNVPGAQLVDTSAGKLQVLDTGRPSVKESHKDFLETANGLDKIPYLGLTGTQQKYVDTPMVLVHGSAGAINWWDELIPLLSNGHRVIAIDMLGYGGSDKPDSDYSVETQAGLIAQVLSRLDVPEAILVGHSLGGKVVTSVAEQSPELVAGLVIIDTAPDNSFGGLTGGAKASQTPLLGQAMWRIAPDFMVRRNIAQGFAPGFDVPDKYVEDVRAMTYTAFKDSAARSQEYTDEKALPDRLAETGKPLMVIFGEQDQLYDARESLSEFAAIPGVQTKLIPDVGHSPQVEAPEQTAAAINSFAYGLAKESSRQAVREQQAQKARAQAKKTKAKAKAKAKARQKARAAKQKARKKNQRSQNSNRNSNQRN